VKSGKLSGNPRQQDCFTLKFKAGNTFFRKIRIYKPTQHHMPEHSNLLQHRCGNQKTAEEMSLLQSESLVFDDKK
jgi:hypothetical protein